MFTDIVFWQFEIDLNGNIYTREIDEDYKSRLDLMY